ncbi:J domain-containing protein [Luteimonas dalianensis]|uniref:J domain-containing protein n=1 Tax=Luteimonas dalianensis TaxID=1148196 RepID=UPI003BEF9113
MSGGEALDLALGLLRAPARRGLLAARPLPSGMTTLLEVAGGSGSAARAASAATGASPAELLAASRFFVQQILFIEGASAYRVLGARPDAPYATLQAHHRHLQRWLHPDRDGGEAWDSAFSARVNDAWNQLRTATARRAYDLSLPDSAGAGATAASPARPSGHASGWHPPAAIALDKAPLPQPHFLRRHAGPLAVLAVALACIALLWMERQRDTRPFFEPAASRAPVAEPAGTANPEPARVVVEPVAPAPRPLAMDANDAAPVAEPRELPPTEPAAHVATTGDLQAGEDVAYAEATAAPAAPSDRQPKTLAHIEPVTLEPAAPPADPAPAEPQPGPDPLQLFTQAEHTAFQATTYLASDGSHIPPIWNDFPTEAAAADTRAGLALRLDGSDFREINLDSPRWRMGAERAMLDADYRIGGWRTRERGQLRVEMTRREQRWLVTRLTLEPSS